MKHTALFISICLVFTTAQAQQGYSIEKYHQSVHQAAVSVCLNDLKGAAELYDLAFSQVRSPFFADVNNALYVQVNSAKPDTARIIKYLNLLQHKGICVHKEYKAKEKFVPYLDLAIENNCRKVLDSVDKKLMSTVRTDDERLRNESIKKYGEAYHASLLPKIKRVDSINYGIVQKILLKAEKLDVPLEDLVGFYAYNTVFTILLHNVEWGRINKPLMERLAKKGIVDSRNVASDFDDYLDRRLINAQKVGLSNDACSGFGFYGTKILTLTMKGALIKIPTARCYTVLNSRRKQLYLQDAVQDAKIKTFAMYNYVNGFEFTGMIMLAADQETFNAIEKNLRKKYKIIKYASRDDFDFNRN